MSTHSQLANWNPTWAHIWLKRKSELKGRRPVIEMHAAKTDEERRFAKAYWNGGRDATWIELQNEVDGLHDVGILVERSNLVVLDCDVKHYEKETGFVVDGNTAEFQTIREARTEYGIDDLAQAAERLGHSMDELNTYTVRSKSDGRHLYFTQNRALALTSKSHRHEWRVDVKASENTWVVAPPTENYWIVNDVPVMEMPFWLAEFLRDVNQHFAPVGGRRTRALQRYARQLRDRSLVANEVDRQSLFGEWIAYELQVVADAQAANTNWNNSIFDCAANLAEGGWSADDLVPVIRKVAQPRTRRDENLMTDTITSAVRLIARKKWSTK